MFHLLCILFPQHSHVQEHHSGERLVGPGLQHRRRVRQPSRRSAHLHQNRLQQGERASPRGEIFHGTRFRSVISALSVAFVEETRTQIRNYKRLNPLTSTVEFISLPALCAERRSTESSHPFFSCWSQGAAAFFLFFPGKLLQKKKRTGVSDVPIFMQTYSGLLHDIFSVDILVQCRPCMRLFM